MFAFLRSTAPGMVETYISGKVYPCYLKDPTGQNKVAHHRRSPPYL